jgi:hypothetical protein
MKIWTIASHWQEHPVLVMEINAQRVTTRLKILMGVNIASDECNGIGECVHIPRDGAQVSLTLLI